MVTLLDKILRRNGNAHATTAHRNRVLDGELLRLSPHPGDVIQGRDIVTNTLAFGSPGVGKSSALLRQYLMAMLEARGIVAGGIITTFKAEDKAFYLRCIRDAGREDDLVIISGAPDSPRLNVLQYLYDTAPPGFGAQEAIGCLMDITGARAQHQGASGKDDFFQKAAHELLTSIVTIARLSGGNVALSRLDQLVKSIEHVDGACTHALHDAANRPLSADDEEDFAHALEFVRNVWPARAPETKSSILAVLSGTFDPLLQNPFRRLFSTETHIRPENTFSHGQQIWLLDFPLDMYAGSAARDAQLLIKYAWAKAIRRRADRDNPNFPIGFCLMDEYPAFATEEDFRTTGVIRSSRGAILMLAQSRASLLSALGGRDATSKADGLIANCGTKFFMACDHETATFAADTIGRTLQNRRSFNLNIAPQNQQQNPWNMMRPASQISTSSCIQETVEHQILPVDIATQPVGSAFVHQTGRIWEATGTNWLPVTFSQGG